MTLTGWWWAKQVYPNIFSIPNTWCNISKPNTLAIFSRSSNDPFSAKENSLGLVFTSVLLP